MLRTLFRRLAKLKHTRSSKTFPRQLASLLGYPKKTALFFGMNHQFIRTTILLNIIAGLRISAFVETGTNVGKTCFLIASQTNLPIFSSEVNKRFFRIARWFLSPFGSRVQLSNEDSVQFLSRIVPIVQADRPVFYLDAHWYEKLPLKEEMVAILSGCRSVLIVIDDFKVPSDSGFGYDRYGEAALEWSYLECAVLNSGTNVSIFFPAYPSMMETGDRRGWVVIASSDCADKIKAIVPPQLLSLHWESSVARPIGLAPDVLQNSAKG